MSERQKQIVVPLGWAAALVVHTAGFAWFISTKFSDLERKIDKTVHVESWDRSDMADWSVKLRSENPQIEVPFVPAKPAVQ